ncbi:MAG TPA: 50S ribosomal protein L5 [Nitrospinota bacterium]|jgi:large subunit ribosomal protein L5|nr:50S ribosomal protein L5 [Nitrospinota bacterium]|tara:strand:- start:218549 stop:219088 length:540 start_codon:yes stop_codon:yes gene_type:complete
MPTLEDKYTKDLIPALTKEFGYKNKMEAPRLEKISLNVGLGEAIQNSKLIEDAIYTLKQISGQKPIVTKSKRAISNFKLRQGVSIGTMVTMRGNRMYEFLERLITAAIPRIRDFKGVSGKAFDGNGNYTLGIREQLIFPEVDYDKISSIKGLNITMVTTAKTDAEAKSLLRGLGLPFRN